MSYYDRDRGYNHRNRNGPRINESEVPESKHTIFIRGLSGDVTQDDVKEYIEERIGKISFDFVKISQDRTKLFVAVRFESREDAKEFMKTYCDRDFMDHRCSLSWFRDIRRYCAYQQSKMMNNRRSSPRRRRRSDSDTSRKSRSRSRSRDSDRSRSSGKNRSRSGSRSDSNSRSRSRSSRRDSRSRSPVPKSQKKNNDRDLDGVPMEFSDSDNDTKPDIKKINKKNKRSYSPEGSDGEWRSDEEKKKPKKNRKVNDYSNGMSPISDRSRSASPTQSRRKSSAKTAKKESSAIPSIPLPPKPATPASPAVFIPPPSMQNDDVIVIPKPIVVNKEIKFNLKVEGSPVLGAAAMAVQNTRFSVGLEDEGTPKTIIKDGFIPPPTPPEFPKAATPSSLPPPPIPPPITVRSSNHPTSGFIPVDSSISAHNSFSAPSTITTPATFIPDLTNAQIQNSNQSTYQNSAVPYSNGQLGHSPIPPVPEKPAVVAPRAEALNIRIKKENSIDYPTTNRIFGHLEEFQTKILSTIKYVPKDEEDDGSLSTLRLSSLNTEEDAEEEKKLERELKLSKLTDEQTLRFNVKKKQFETAFRNDCETYAIVTRALLAKDESLENGLKMSFVENMEDLYKKMMQRVDDFLETLVK